MSNKTVFTDEQLALIEQCDGVHTTIDELFNCDSCKIIFTVA